MPKLPPAIIFLDIDGVLHGASAVAEAKATMEGKWEENVRGNFNKGGRLQRIVEETGAALCLSSSWRREEDNMELLREGFEDEDEGFGLEIWGLTPFSPRFKRSMHRRETEIMAFFEEEDIDPNKIPWIAMDDEDLFQLPKDRFVHTAGDGQLTEKKADEAIRKLKQQMK
jgi:hypothetical protein